MAYSPLWRSGGRSGAQRYPYSVVSREPSLRGTYFLILIQKEWGKVYQMFRVSYHLRCVGVTKVRGTFRPFQIISVVILVLGSGFHYKEQSAFSVDRVWKRSTRLERGVCWLGLSVPPSRTLTTSLISLMCFLWGFDVFKVALFLRQDLKSAFFL